MTLCAGVSLAVHLHYLEARLNRQECFVRLRTWLYYAESPSSENVKLGRFRKHTHHRQLFEQLGSLHTQLRCAALSVTVRPITAKQYG